MSYEISRMFQGPHRHTSFSTQGNREIVRAACCDVTVTPEELCAAIGSDGVDAWMAQRLVETLIIRARDTAVARTLGLKEPQ